VLLVLVLLGLLFAAYIFFMLKWSYSSGERAGWVQKLSHKGWLCKTWEGELSMVAMPGAAPEKFFFTVWDEKVATEINQNMGRRVSLHYEEKIGIPTECFGETRYFVTRINALEAPQTPGAPAPVTPSGTAPAPTAPPPAPISAPAPTSESTPAPAAPPAAEQTPTSAPSQSAAPPPASGGSGLRIAPQGGGSGLSLKPGS
jgi:hypothetical protein